MALDITLAVLSCLMAIFGVYVTFWPPAEGARKKFLLGFVFLTLASVIVIGLQASHRQKDQARQDAIQNELRAQNVKLQTDVTRLLFPVKDVSVTFRLNVPLEHPRLNVYRSRLEKCIEQIVATQQSQCGVTIPIRTVEPSEIDQICVPPRAELYPRRGSESLAHSILNNVLISFTVFRTFSKEQYLRKQLTSDLSFSVSETLNSPEHGETRRVQLCYEIKTKTLFLWGSRVPVDSKRWNSNGQLIAIPELKRATFVIHPATLLLIYKLDQRGSGGDFTEDTMTAIEISETTSLRSLTLHFSNSEDMEMPHTRLTSVSTSDYGINGRVYVYEPQAK